MYICIIKKCIQSLDSVSFCSIGFMWIMQLKKTTSKAIAWNRYFYFLEYLIYMYMYIYIYIYKNFIYKCYIYNIYYIYHIYVYIFIDTYVWYIYIIYIIYNITFI